MGCVNGREEDRIHDGDEWRHSLPKTHPQLSEPNSTIRDVSGEGVFIHRVRMCGEAHDMCCDVMRCLLSLVYVRKGESAKVKTRICIRALVAMRAVHDEALADIVVPITNVMLHAPRLDTRKELWEMFVRETVTSDTMLGHLFYWALKCAVDCPTTEEHARNEASQMLRLISDSLSAGGRRLSGANRAPVTPLIDLFERLHFIGEEIVKISDRAARLQGLRSLIDEHINQPNLGATPVPVHLMSSDESRCPSKFRYATVLNLPAEGAIVLSSKARAPYTVCVEVSHVNQTSSQVDAGGGGLCPCRSRQPRPRALTAPASHGDHSPRTGKEQRHQDMIKDFAKESDARPKGLFKEPFADFACRLKSQSNFAGPNWHLIPLIVKARADDVRQEELAYRLLRWFERLFARHKLNLWLRPFIIIATTYDGGCLEAVSNSISLDALKKHYGDSWISLKNYFDTAFPRLPVKSRRQSIGNGQKVVLYQDALMNFAKSMAAYSIICYVLAIRDRHNGNIMLDDEGHIIHVDFGFMLCGAPGGKVLQKMGGFEHSGGFKLSQEMAEVMGGPESPAFQVFREAVIDGMMAVRQEADDLLAMLQLSMLGAENFSQPCFAHPLGYPEAVVDDLRHRLRLHEIDERGREVKPMADDEFHTYVMDMIDHSQDHWRTVVYDWVQLKQNDIR